MGWSRIIYRCTLFTHTRYYCVRTYRYVSNVENDRRTDGRTRATHRSSDDADDDDDDDDDDASGFGFVRVFVFVFVFVFVVARGGEPSSYRAWWECESAMRERDADARAGASDGAFPSSSSSFVERVVVDARFRFEL
jgi:hypothetical protein